MTTPLVLTPWNRVAIPHDDIVAGDFDMSTYAANLDAVDRGDPRCPPVYRNAADFYGATHMTPALDELLRGVVSVLSGAPGNRVVQLRTPFGGGKTHTLIALLHLLRGRAAVDALGVLPALPDPGPVRVAVLACNELNAAEGRTVADGVRLHTLWGELAWRLGGEPAYRRVQAADEGRVKPGAEVLRALLSDAPSIVLLDEVLMYVEAAMGVPVGPQGDTNLGRQTMSFLFDLTEVTSGLPRAAMVYSLQASVQQALGASGTLQQLDSLVSRVDAKKEPVSGDDVLQVVRKRLFRSLGGDVVRSSVSRAYGDALRGYLFAQSQTDADQRMARDAGGSLARRMAESWPFHPDLLDLMYHRWGSLPTYQRTRGALQFLATVVGALWKRGDGGSVIGPGDVPLDDANVRNAFFSQVGEREQMNSVLDADLSGPAARCRRVDDAVAVSTPALAAFRPAARLTRALALYSFGAKQGEDRGVLLAELLGSVQQPDLPADVLEVTLQQLTDTLLYIHSSGRRYRFEKRPNLNKLLDDEAHKLVPAEVQHSVGERLTTLLANRDTALVWPADSAAIPDKKGRFIVAFLGAEMAMRSPDETTATLRAWTEMRGENKRHSRNGLAFAVPSAAAMDEARTAARRMMAAERLRRDRSRHGIDDDGLRDVEERRARAGSELDAAIRRLYPTLYLPVAAPKDVQDPIRLERFDIPPYQAVGAPLFDNVKRQLENWVFDRAVPRKLIDCVHLGAGEAIGSGDWIAGPGLVDLFFGSVNFPKLWSTAGLKETISQGVTRGAFGYVLGAEERGGGLVLSSPDALTMGEHIGPEDIDLGAGSFIVSARYGRVLAESARPTAPDCVVVVDPGEPASALAPHAPIVPPPPNPSAPRGEPARDVRLEFRAGRAPLFAAFQAIRVLGDLSEEDFVASIHITARLSRASDRHVYETSVVMALEEAGVTVLKQ
jgi:hypothetical protein